MVIILSQIHVLIKKCENAIFLLRDPFSSAVNFLISSAEITRCKQQNIEFSPLQEQHTKAGVQKVNTSKKITLKVLKWQTKLD